MKFPFSGFQFPNRKNISGFTLIRLLLRRKRSCEGFTLIELLVVVFIIGILVGLLTVALNGTRASSRDAQRKAHLESIRSALEIYRSDCGSYPALLSFGDNLTGSGASCSSNTYLSPVPQDPLNGSQGYKYEYYYDSTGKKYKLCAYLENGGTGALCESSVATSKCGNTVICNYTVNNP